MKKSLVAVLIFLILTNFIFASPCYASTDASDTNTFTQDDYDNMSNEGVGDTGVSVVGTIVGFIAKIINAIPMTIQFLISIVLSYGGIIEDNCTQDDIGLFSIQNIIIGKYLLLDANVFRDLSEGIDTPFNNQSSMSFTDTIKDIRTTVSFWFVVLRDLAIVINLAMLLYIAIRLAIVTLAADKARYKELLYNWVISMIILFTLPYLMSIVNTIAEVLVGFARNLMISLEKSNKKSFENELLLSMFGLISENGGLKVALYSIVYWALIWTEFKFFTMYSKRMLSIFFLVIISPIITVTYAVDKIADKKAQAFDRWLHEYATNLFIQPLHCGIYLVFMYMANNIALEAPLVGVVFLMSLTKGEKIVKSLLAISGVSIKGVGDEFSMKGLKGSLKGLVPKPGPKPGST